MNDENEYVRVMELQRVAISMLEKLLADYKEFYKAEKSRADTLAELLNEINGCPGCEPREPKSEKELIKIYGVI